MSDSSIDPPANGPVPAISPRKQLLPVVLFVVVYAALVFLPFLGSARTLTRHEVSVTQPALDLLRTGNWLVPQYIGRPWVHKPPLVIWMTAAVYALTGFNEYAARLPAALSAIALCGLVAALTGRFFDRKTALLAGLVQATCVYGYMQGRLGEIDMTFGLLMTAAQAVLAWHWGRGELKLPPWSAVLFHTLAGLAVLAKGPLAVVLLGLTVLGFCWLRRSWRPLVAVLWTPAVLCSLFVGFGWYAAVILHLGQAAVDRWEYSYVQRFLGHYHLAGKSPAFYLYTIPWLMLPWTIALVIGIRRLVADVRRSDAHFDRFLWMWFLTGLVFLSIAGMRHAHYAIPILPPLSVWTARLLVEHLARGGKHARRFYIVVFVVTPIIFGIAGGVVMPRRDHRQPTVDFLRESIPLVPADQPLYLAGLAQSSVYPYVGRDFGYVSSLGELRDMLQDHGDRPLWILTLRKHLATGEALGLSLDEVAAEPARKHHPPEETHVLGRLVIAPPP